MERQTQLRLFFEKYFWKWKFVQKNVWSASLSIPNLNTTVLHDTNGRIYDKYEIGPGYVFKHSMCCFKNWLYFSQFTPLKLCSKH